MHFRPGYIAFKTDQDKNKTTVINSWLRFFTNMLVWNYWIAPKKHFVLLFDSFQDSLVRLLSKLCWSSRWYMLIIPWWSLCSSCDEEIWEWFPSFSRWFADYYCWKAVVLTLICYLFFKSVELDIWCRCIDWINCICAGCCSFIVLKFLLVASTIFSQQLIAIGDVTYSGSAATAPISDDSFVVGSLVVWSRGAFLL